MLDRGHLTEKIKRACRPALLVWPRRGPCWPCGEALVVALQRDCECGGKVRHGREQTALPVGHDDDLLLQRMDSLTHADGVAGQDRHPVVRLGKVCASDAGGHDARQTQKTTRQDLDKT